MVPLLSPNQGFAQSDWACPCGPGFGLSLLVQRLRAVPSLLGHKVGVVLGFLAQNFLLFYICLDQSSDSVT